MESPTRYDLNAAIESWRSELATLPNLTAEVRRELETHLCDAIAGFQQRGLNDEESFWLACKRLGQPLQLSEEFVKANPVAVWRDRIFWVSAILLVLNVWSGIAMVLYWMVRTVLTTPYMLSHYRIIPLFPDWVRFYLPLPSSLNLYDLMFSTNSMMVFRFFSLLPLIAIPLLLSRGRLSQSYSLVRFFFNSRRRFLSVSATFFAAYFYLLVFVNCYFPSPGQSISFYSMLIMVTLNNLPYPVLLVGLIAWLLPSRNPKTPRCA